MYNKDTARLVFGENIYEAGELAGIISSVFVRSNNCFGGYFICLLLGLILNGKELLLELVCPRRANRGRQRVGGSFLIWLKGYSSVFEVGLMSEVLVNS